MNEAANRRRLTFEAREPGGWTYYVEEHDGDEWQPCGQEIVDRLDVEIQGIVAAGEVEL